MKCGARPVSAGTFARGGNAPVHRHALVTFSEAFAVATEVKVTPRGVLAYRRDEVVRRLIETVVVVLVEQDRFRFRS